MSQLLEREILHHFCWEGETPSIAIGYGQFDAPGENTTFTLLGGAAAGSHASAVTTANVSLHIQGPWESF